MLGVELELNSVVGKIDNVDELLDKRLRRRLPGHRRRPA